MNPLSSQDHHPTPFNRSAPSQLAGGQWSVATSLVTLSLLFTDPPPVTLELTKLMGSSPSQARDALTSFLRSCCTDAKFCSDLFMELKLVAKPVKDGGMSSFVMY